MAPTSSHQEGRPYDVFLSHAGEQKLGVVSHTLALFNTAHPEVEVFVDDWSLPPGQRGEPNIFRALDECAVFVVVLSQAFVRKTWPMDEVGKMRKRLTESNANGAESVRVMWVGYDITYKELENLKAAVYSKPGGRVVDAGLNQGQAQDDIDWLLGFTGLRRDQDARLAESDLVARVVDDALAALRGVRGLQPYGSQERVVMFGREADLAKLADMRAGGAFVLLYGPSGIGKTTLATGAYEQFAPEFGPAATAVNYWFSLRGADRSVLSLQREFMVGALRCTELEVASCPSARDRRAAIAARLKGKSVLLVVDDVQSKEQLAELLPIELLDGGFLSPGSLVLVTARTADVLQQFQHRSLTARSTPAEHCRLLPIHEYPVGPLTDLQDCRRLFCWHAFQSLALPRDLTSLEVRLSKAVEQCKQLPPVLVVTASQVATLAGSQQKGTGCLPRTAFQRVFNRLSSVKLAADGDSPLHALERNFELLGPEMQAMLLDVAIYFSGQPWQLAWRYCEALIDSGLQSTSLQMQDRDELPTGLGGLKDMALVCQTWEGPVAVVTVHDFVREFCELKAASAADGKRLVVVGGSRRPTSSLVWKEQHFDEEGMWGTDVVCLQVSQAQQLRLPVALPPAPLKHRLLFFEEASLLEEAGKLDGPAGTLEELVHVRLKDVAPQKPAAWLLEAAFGPGLRVVELHQLQVNELDLQVLKQVEVLLLSELQALEQLSNLGELTNLQALHLTSCSALQGQLSVGYSVEQLYLEACPLLTGVAHRGDSDGGQLWHTVVIKECTGLEHLGFAAPVAVLKVHGSQPARCRLLSIGELGNELQQLDLQLAPSTIAGTTSQQGSMATNVTQQGGVQRDTGPAVFVTNFSEEGPFGRLLRDRFSSVCPNVGVYFYGSHAEPVPPSVSPD